MVVNIAARTDDISLPEVFSHLLNHESRVEQLSVAANLESEGSFNTNLIGASFHKRKVTEKVLCQEVSEAMDVVEAEEEPILAAVEIGQPVRYVVNMDIQDINVSFALIGGSLQDKKQHKQVRPLPMWHSLLKK